MNPLILSIIGQSDSGKTTLILKLLPELKKRGKKVAVAKHCPRGFDLDTQGKDSWKFAQAGSDGIFLSSPDKIAHIRAKENSANIKEKLQDLFKDFDIVLMEGYSNEANIKKIQIIRSKIGGEILSTDQPIAYISDMPLKTEKPVYKLDDISGIISFIEDLEEG